MTDEPRASAEDADMPLIEQIAQLRGIKPSPEAQNTFHQLVAAELVAIRRAPSVAWWRRSIRVPAPVCIAAGLTVFVLLFARLPGAVERPISVPTAAPRNPATKPEPSRRTASTYVLGVGTLTTETRFISTED